MIFPKHPKRIEQLERFERLKCPRPPKLYKCAKLPKCDGIQAVLKAAVVVMAAVFLSFSHPSCRKGDVVLLSEKEEAGSKPETSQTSPGGISKGFDSSGSGAVGIEDAMRTGDTRAARPQKDSPSYGRQLELLAVSWVRDPFSLESLRSSNRQGSRKNASRNAAQPRFPPSPAIPSASVADPSHAAAPSEKGRRSGLELTGIVFFDNQYMALINGIGMREGDKISGFKVTRIEKDFILLTDSSGNKHRMELR